MELQKHELFIVQPTTLCNLDCKYCWLPERHLNKKMSHSTFRSLLNRIANAANNLAAGASMVWHGGEPLALGTDYYRRCLEDLRTITKERGFNFITGIQTNAVLINEEWINLFKEYDVQIGISIDGPAWVHDQRRVHRNGKSTHVEVERGMHMLSNSGIQFSVISVLSAFSINYPDELFKYFRTVPTSGGFAFNIDEDDGVNTNSSILDRNADQKDMFARVRRFFLRLFEINEKAGRPLDIRDFSKYYRFVDGISPLGDLAFNSMVRPGALINIDHAGNISTYCPELLMGYRGLNNPFVFGNVENDDFISIVSDAQFQAASKAIISGREKCRETCDYFMVCGAGSPSNRYSELHTLDASETLFCRNHVQATAEAVIGYLEGERVGSRVCQ